MASWGGRWSSRFGTEMNIEWQTVTPRTPRRVSNDRELLLAALGASRGLQRLLQQGTETDQPILLLVNDPDRSTQTRPVLSAIAELSRKVSVARRTRREVVRCPRFRALVATGTHRFSDQDREDFERRTFDECGLDVQGVAWHDAHAGADMAPLGEFHLHHWVVESSVLLPIGSCEPHYFAGVTGPHKTVTIGCMAFDDIQANHAAAMDPDADLLRLDGNPVHEGIKRALGCLSKGGRAIAAVGQVVLADRIIAVQCGEPLDVVAALAPIVRDTYTWKIARPADIVRLRLPPPLGRTLYQADKAIKNNRQAVRRGGAIILEAECGAGVGPDAFLGLLRRTHDHAMAQHFVNTEGYRLGDHKALKLRQLMDPAGRDVRLAIVSKHLGSPDLAETGIEVFDDLEPALLWASRSVGGRLNNGLIVENAGLLSVGL